jgi:hypothetical protein
MHGLQTGLVVDTWEVEVNKEDSNVHGWDSAML